MKELSIEEKAKRYDEALRKARQLCDYPTTKPFISDLQDIFPELAEPEDERIRKAVMEFFELQDDNTTYSLVSKKDILAWLEKHDCKDIHLLEIKAKAYDDAKERMSYAYNQNRVPIGFMNEIFPNIKLYEKQGEQKTTWKPTEEQIEALEHLLETIRRHEYSYFHEEKFLSLHSLLEQLKEL